MNVRTARAITELALSYDKGVYLPRIGEWIKKTAYGGIYEGELFWLELGLANPLDTRAKDEISKWLVDSGYVYEWYLDSIKISWL